MSAPKNLKPPAPVLPAMNVHSFGLDSPPFSGATDYPDPEAYSLEPGQAISPPLRTPIPHHRASSAPTPTHELYRPLGEVPPPAPSSHGEGPISPVTEERDNIRNSNRSRSLRSGYTFGPSAGPDVDASTESSESSPPSLPGQDSPPLLASRASFHTLREPEPDHNPSGMGPAGAESSRLRKGSTFDGLDALSGLNDGEADLDATAIPAEGNGTEGYLKGVDGDAGEYHFPRHRLRTTMKDESKIPLVIVACGSFSPPTYLHLRMFEMAKDEIVESQTYEIMAGYYSPVSSYYKKAGLAPALSRVRMCELAVENTSTWLMVDPWEAGQPEYQRTAVVLEHFEEMLNGNGGGVTMANGQKRKIKIMLLAGGDLIESFGEPGVWSEPDLHVILGRFGCFIVERAGSDVWAFLLSHDILYHHRRNVVVVKQLIYNDISSTKVRLFVRRGMSIKYLLPNSVIQYIYDHKLYREPEAKPAITQ